MPKPCKVSGCKLPHDAKGYCKTHYLRWRRTGSTERTRPIYDDGRSIREHLIEKFLNGIRKLESGCWACDTAEGGGKYPRVKIDRGNFGSDRMSVHRLSYEHFNGPIPDGMLVCHKCDNPLCCNPDHLFLGDHKDNAVDASQKDRTNFGEKGTNTRLTENEVIEIYEKHDAGVSASELGRQYGVTYQCIFLIVTGKNWNRTYQQHRLRKSA